MPAIICARCKSVVIPFDGLVVLTTSGPGEPERRRVICRGCGERLAEFLKERQAVLASAAE